MSVLVKGMKMPKSCDDCWFEYAYEICTPETGYENCPLIELLSHGRCIDADSKTFPTFHRNPSNDYMKGWNACLKSVQQQPTIIPAEEGECDAE